MSLEGQSASLERRSKALRAFCPLFIWIVISTGLLCWDYHKKNAPLIKLNYGLTVDGREIDRLHEVSILLDDEEHDGRPISIGRHRLKIAGSRVETLQTNIWIWYGTNDLGVVDLISQKGNLQLLADPEIKELVYSGPRSGRLSRVSGTESLNLPVGKYQVEARYEFFTNVASVSISQDRIEQLNFTPPVGTARLTSTPPGLNFLLKSTNDSYMVKVTGVTPQTLAALPAGAFAGEMWRDDFRRQFAFSIERDSVSNVALNFDFGMLEVITKPKGIAVTLRNELRGITPLIVSNLVPGEATLALNGEGLIPLTAQVSILPGESTLLSTNLVSEISHQALVKAERALGGSPPQYRQALALLEKALSAQPVDPSAKILTEELRAKVQNLDELEAKQQAIRALAERRADAIENFDRAVKSIVHNQLFDTTTRRYTNSFHNARSAILTALSRTDPQWEVEQEGVLDKDGIVLHCRPKGLVVMGKRSAISLSQTSVEEVVISAKFWDYDLKGRVRFTFGGIDQDSLIPIHPSSFPRDQAAVVEARRRLMPASFFNALDQLLQ